MARQRLLLKPVEAFVRIEGSGGIALLVAAVVAVAWANSPVSGSYHDLWGWSRDVSLANIHRHVSLHAFVNDGLMAVFFYVVGLEIKRELVEGELNTLRRAALPAIAALGGMVVPALIYVAFNAGHAGAHGWGIPMATDIAFAVGVLTLLGSRVPLSLKVFLLALAIVDDLGAIVVIALFYAGTIDILALAIGAGGLIVVFVALRAGVRSWVFYLAAGLVTWVAVLESGVHATIAGVALGFLTSTIRAPGGESALDMIERTLHPWVSYLIVPVFALANAGVVVSGSALHAAVTSQVSLGIAFGLVFGKPIGIVAAAWLAVRTRVAELPEGVTWAHIVGAGMLGGIGFTVSLFITGLAFDPEALIADAKIGIFAASIVAAVAGLAWLALIRRAPSVSLTVASAESAHRTPAARDEPVS